MIIVEKQALKFLLAGRKITVTARREHKKGRTYAVGVRHNRTVCRARILKASESADGWLLLIEQAAEEAPRLLARNPGAQRTDYVAQVSKAASGEPEAVDEATQRRLSAQGSFRWMQEHNRRRAQRAAMALEARIVQIEKAHGRSNADVSRQLASIRRRVEALRKIAA